MKKIFTLVAALAMVISMSAVNIEEGTKLYLTPNGNWKVDNARFAAYFFNGGGDSWASMTAVEGETDVYEVSAPTGSWEQVIFCRMNPNAIENNWGNKWNQTKNLTYDGTKNHCIIEEGAWDNCGSWVVYGSGETPEPTPKPDSDVYTIVGDKALVGSNWNTTDTNNDMLKQDDNTYKLVKENVTLSKGSYAYKVCKGHTWGTGEYPSGQNNKVLTIDASGVYNITFTYDGGESLNATPTLVEEKEIIPVIQLAGEMTGWKTPVTLTASADGLTASTTITMDAKTYEFKIAKDGVWLGNNGTMKRENDNQGWDFKVEEINNCKIEADIAGDYVFTWNYDKNQLAITFPKATPTEAVDNVTVEEVKAIKVIRNGQMYILRDGVLYNAIGQVAE